MGTTAQKLSKVLNTKNEIKDILLSKGAIEETTPFGEYPAIICKLGVGDGFAVKANTVKLNPTHRYATTDSSIAIGTFNTSVMGVLQNDNE